MSSFKFNPEKLLAGLTETESKAEAAIKKFAESGANKLEAYAKENARWQNRTGDARRRLKGSTEQVKNGYRLSLAHGVDYGIWLELAMERRYAIIEETIQKVGQDEIMPAFKNFMERLGGAK